MRTQRSVDSGVLALTPGGPRLLGGRCTACGTFTFPDQDGCPRCTAMAMEPVELATRGTLWAWTVQAFPPKSPPYLGPTDPEEFAPFGVGYVELSGEVKVEARLTESDPERLRIGMPLELTVIPFRTDPDGTEVMVFAFAPTEPTEEG